MARQRDRELETVFFPAPANSQPQLGLPSGLWKFRDHPTVPPSGHVREVQRAGPGN